MRFEQAFHYRDINSGLGIYASSDSSYSFTRSCEEICEDFVKEDGRETAEFVLYSNQLGRFVGIGVSPFESRDKANRLVQIWVPVEASSTPSDYYLRYEFEQDFDKERKYEQREFDPCISEQDYLEVLRKYNFSHNSLARLLAETVPIIFGSYRKLAIVFPENRFSKEEKRTAAREIMWLISVLMPVPEDKRREFGSRLSYSVFSEKNRKKVAISFVDNVPEDGSCYMLECDEPVPDNDRGKNLYNALAEKAMESLESYREFIKELTDCGFPEDQFDRDTLNVMYFYWGLRCGRITEIEEEDLPIEYTQLIFKAMRSKGYCDLLFRVLVVPNNLDRNLQAAVQRNVFEKDNVWSGDDSGDLRSNAVAAYAAMLENTFESGNRTLIDTVWEIKDPDLKKEVLTKLWLTKGDDSCIARDINEITDIDTFKEKLSYYKDLTDNDSFKKQMCSVLFDRDLYFKMDRKERSAVSSVLDPGATAFVYWIRKKIEACFHLDFEKGLNFIKLELVPLEHRYVADYFRCFLENSRNAEKKYRREVQKTGHEFIDVYSDNVDQKDKEDFWGIDRSWKLKDLKDILEEASLNELAAFDFKDFKDYAPEDRNDFANMWLEEVRSRIRDASQPDQSGISFEVFKKLVSRDKELSREYPAVGDEFREMLWEASGSDMQRKILCSNAFGTVEYTIWASDLLNKDVYEEILKVGNTGIETKRISGNEVADLNRRCYLLWKGAGGMSQMDIRTLRELSEETANFRLHEEWTALVADMIDRARGDAKKSPYNRCVNYLHLYAEMMKDFSLDERCADYECLYMNDSVFYQDFLSQLGSYKGEDAKYIREMKWLKELWDIGEVNEDNILMTAEILESAERVFGEYSAPIRDTQSKYEEAMKKLKTAINETDTKIESIESHNEELRRLIQQNGIRINRLHDDQRSKRELAEEAGERRKGRSKPKSLKRNVEPLPECAQSSYDEEHGEQGAWQKKKADTGASEGKIPNKLCESVDVSVFS